jgi:hypothetical protein
MKFSSTKLILVLALLGLALSECPVSTDYIVMDIKEKQLGCSADCVGDDAMEYIVGPVRNCIRCKERGYGTCDTCGMVGLQDCAWCILDAMSNPVCMSCHEGKMLNL